MATELIAWLRSKTRILSYLPLAVLRAILTRWTAHYTSFVRLLTLSSDLIIIANKDLAMIPQDLAVNGVMITGDRAAQVKARKMVDVIKNPVFWQKIAL
jgi:hypothetical protein